MAFRSRSSRRGCCALRQAHAKRDKPQGDSRVIAEIAVDLGAIVRNAQALARLVAPARRCAVIKADAYGHGLVPVARALEPHAARLCVYALEEGVALREAGIGAQI